MLGELAGDLAGEELHVFLLEAESLLGLLDADIVRLEQQDRSDDLLQEIFRAAHTLKGSSSMLGFEAMTGLTHAMEDLLDRMRRRLLPVTPTIVDALLMSLDGLRVLCARVRAADDTPFDVAPIVEALRAAAVDETGVASMLGVVPSFAATIADDAALRARIEAATGTVYLVTARIREDSEWAAVRCFQVLNALDRSGEVIASLPSQAEIEAERVGRTIEVLIATEEPVEQLIALLEHVDETDGVSVARWDAASMVEPVLDEVVSARGTLATMGPRIDALQSTVRIDVQQLDAMMNLVGELVIDRTRISQLGRLLGGQLRDDLQVRALQETSMHLEKVVDALQEHMLRVRMLPVGLLFSKFPRLVRDLARGMGKQIRLEIEGEDTEVDRSVIEQISDPLIHLIRNAAAHGIETVEEREAAGKPALAILRLTARHEQGRIVITLEDDGRGIDTDRVRTRAVERGLLTAEQAARLSHDEAVALIFAPGLSTATATTELSGRGVGMDIVRRDIEALKGHVEVDTERGRGTTFRLRLPLTLATMRSLLVSCGRTTYAIPLTYVQETLRPSRAQLQSISGRSVLSLRGGDAVMSMIWLDEALGLDVSRAGGDEPYVVVVRIGEDDRERPVAIAVDRLIDQQEIVVKPLDGALGRSRGIAGASILGDGQVVLIVDVATLIKAHRMGDMSHAA